MNSPAIVNVKKYLYAEREKGRVRKILRIVAIVVTTGRPLAAWELNGALLNLHTQSHYKFVEKLINPNVGNGRKKYAIGIENDDVKNGHGGRLKLTLKNEHGYTAICMNVKLRGYNTPYANGRPFITVANSDGHRMIGVRLCNVLENEYKIRWFYEDKEIDEKDQRYCMLKSVPGYGQKCSALMIKIPENECEGTFKTIVKNDDGEFHCRINMKPVRKLPYLWEKVGLTMNHITEKYLGEREAVKVSITVPFSSYMRQNLVRWSCNKELSDRITKFEGYRQTLNMLSNNRYEAKITFKMTCSEPEKERIYRCDVINDVGKMSAFARIKLTSTDCDLSNIILEEDAIAGNLSQEEQNAPYWEITDVEEY